MQNSKDRIKFFLYTLLLFPALIIFGEIFLGLLNKFEDNSPLSIKKNTSLTYKDQFILDQVNGWMIEPSKNFTDKHGLIKTPFISDKKINNRIKAILITGNSVAVGQPVIYEKTNKTFVNILELKLRDKHKNIDILNASHPGFNSWQEHVESVRYLNSYKNHNDLPKPILISSMGGVQDFWGLISLMLNDENYYKNYRKASGLMNWKIHGLSIYERVNKSLKGDIASGFKLFLTSSKKFIIENSNIYHYLQDFKRQLKKSNQEIDASKERNKPLKIFSSDDDFELDILLRKLFNKNLDHYISLRNKAIDSVVMNLKSTAALDQNVSLLYIYLPTRFSSGSTRKDLIINYDNFNFTSKELHTIEKDYRAELFKRLKLINSIDSIDLATKGEDNWFTDSSHYTLLGQELISNLLYNVLLNKIND